MPLAPSIQQKIMWMTPRSLLEILCRTHPRFVIKLLCHWLNEKNINIEERFLAPRLLNPVGVSKKMSQLSILSILNILRQDDSLWQFYVTTPDGGVILNLAFVPLMLLELMFDLGGNEGRRKVADIVVKCRTTIGTAKQLEILRYFKTDNVLDLFEIMPDMEIIMLLKNPRCEEKMVAFWLGQWDLRMQQTQQPPKSGFWLGQIPGTRAYNIERLLRELEFRRKFDPIGNIYKYESDGIIFLEETE